MDSEYESERNIISHAATIFPNSMPEYQFPTPYVLQLQLTGILPEQLFHMAMQMTQNNMTRVFSMPSLTGLFAFHIAPAGTLHNPSSHHTPSPSPLASFCNTTMSNDRAPNIHAFSAMLA